MPFRSQKQKRFMFANHPKIAKRWVKEAKAQGKPTVQPKRKKK